MAYPTETDLNAAPPVPVSAPETAPVAEIDRQTLEEMGRKLAKTFKEYADDRQQAEQQWLKNLRQYLGIYDPEIERQLAPNRSRAYPRLTRIKSISVTSRIMNLMFPGNEKNWELKASPSADMSPDEIMEALVAAGRKVSEAGVDMAADPAFVNRAIQDLAEERAKETATLIDDQLQELGGDQTLDYIALNRKVVMSGVLYGLGVLRGPFVRAEPD